MGNLNPLHKLAAALVIFLSLSVAAYFIYTGLQEAKQTPQPKVSSSEPHNELVAASTVAESERQAGSESGTLVSSSSIASESAAVESAVIKQVAPSGELEASNPAPELANASTNRHQTITSSQQQATSETSITPSPSPSPPELSGAASSDLPSISPQQNQDLSSSTTTSVSPSSSTTASTLTALLTSGSPASNSPETSPGAPPSQLPTSTSPSPTTDHRHGGDIQQPGELSGANLAHLTTTTSQLYREATQRPREQLVDLSSHEVEQWQEFKAKYNKRYGSQADEDQRRMNFIGNLRFINVFNQRSQALFKLAVNHLADFTQQEINEIFVGPRKNYTQQQLGATTSGLKLMAEQEVLHEDQAAALSPPSIDWRNSTGGEPLDQGACRESSIFAAVASLESALNAATGSGKPRVKLSEQQVIDCLTYNAPPPPAWPQVCQGYLSMMHLFDFLQRQAIRFSTAQEYGAFKQAQLEGRVPPNLCVLPPNSPEIRPKLGAYVPVPRESLDEALQNNGPLVVEMDASQPTFHFYKSGLYHEEACSSESYNSHALLVAATNPQGSAANSTTTSDGEQVPMPSSYTIRASFGTDWGEMGHMRLLRDTQRNKCLPQHTAIYPTVAYE